MHSRIPLVVLSISIFVAVLTLSLPNATAENMRQPFQPTATAQDTPETEAQLTVVPISTVEIDPEALILGNGWQDPTNLSRSGATSLSQMVTDSNGTDHILWVDAVEGFGYAAGRGDQWSQPVAAEYPFFTRRYFPDLQETSKTPRFVPTLVANRQRQILAFWVGDDEVLYTSSVPAENFTSYDAWLPRSALSANTLAISAAASDDGTIHTAYIRNQDSAERPAGVYYRQLDSAGNWQSSILLYPSRYLRSVPAEMANIQVFATGDNHVYVVWDDTLKKQVFFARSSDNGQSWDPVQTIDRRARGDADTAAGPAGITIGGDAEQLHLTWAAGHEENQECSQYVATSTDTGITWPAGMALTSLPGCLSEAQFFSADGTLFLMGTVEEVDPDSRSTAAHTYLLAWDGTRWSEPQLQEPLNRFSNPETNQIVNLSCHFAAGQDNNIITVGCDTADGGDIWLLRREVGETVEWFPLPPVWQGPDLLRSSSSPKFVQLIASSDGIVHAIWNVENEPSIYHSGWDGEQWSASQEIIRTPGAETLSLTAATANDRLFLAWKDLDHGLQFSEASISSANQWADPTSLLENRPEASSPSMVADEGGNIFIAFAEQFNETRGVYLLHSADAGDTWSAPLQVFDGAAAGWEMVEKPLLARTDNGQMHLMWTKRSLPPDSVSLGLAYSRSEDLGQNWSEADLFVETETYWNQLLGTGERTIHRLWTEEHDGIGIVWQSYSQDGGLSWSQAEQVTGLFNQTGAAVIADPVSRMHLITMDNGQLSDLVWQDGSWISDEGLDTSLGDDGYLAASTNNLGEMVVTYVDVREAADGVGNESNLYAMWRTLELPEALPTPLPTLTPTQPPVTVAPTNTPEPTATVFFSTEPEQTGLGEIPGLDGLPISMDLVVAFLPVILIVIIGLIIGIRIIRKR